MNKLIYVCSPYRGDIEMNTKNAREYCRRIVAEGDIPMAPHLLFLETAADLSPRRGKIEPGARSF